MSFKDHYGRESHKQYYLPTVETKDYNVMIDGRNFFDQQIQSDLDANDNIRNMKQVEAMITQLDVYLIIPISKNTTN